MTRGRSSYGEAYWRGYDAGTRAGHTAGYREGMAVLDEAAGLLAELRPSRTVAVVAARQRLANYTGPSLTPHQIRVQAAQSWGLPIPADPTPGLTDVLAEPTEPAAETAPAGAELADDDDWAWQA